MAYKATDEAVKLKQKALGADPEWARKKRATVTATVISVEDDAGTHNITFRFPHGHDPAIKTADGIGIPAVPADATLDKVLDNMAIKDADERAVAKQLLLPTEPFPGVTLASPSTDLLRTIASKLKTPQGKKLPLPAKFNAAAKDIHNRGNTLDDILADEQKLARLQATYDVGEMLELFPGLVTKEELLVAQGPSHGNKTYCLIDWGRAPDEQGRDCRTVTVSVLPEAGVHKHDSFGEGGVESLHLGETSVHLYNLKPGDEVKITSKLKHKSAFQLPRKQSADIIMTGQGNGAASYTTFLREMEERKAKGHKLGKARLMLAARDPESAWGLKRFLPYLERGTLDRIDIAVDSDPQLGEVVAPANLLPGQMSDAARKRIHIHHGTRLVDDRQGVQNHHGGMMNDENIKAVVSALKTGGGVYIAGGEPFFNSMMLGIAEAVRRDIRDMDRDEFRKMVKNAPNTATRKLFRKLRIAPAAEPEDAELLSVIFRQGGTPYTGKAISTHSPARLKGGEKGWSRRIAGKPLVDMCRSGKAPGFCPL